MQVMHLSAWRGTPGMAYNCWLCCVMKASFSLLLHQAHLIHHPKPISVIWWEKCGASGSPFIPISENEKTNNRTWLGLIAKGIMVFTDSLLVEQHAACSGDQMWFKGNCNHHTVLQIVIFESNQR